ncbi:2',3'-cyclic nucleotide 3'-phosphodiesterase [Pleosporales sp. CAS-2024a]
MPGSSLWLLPPKEHPLNSALSGLIDQISSHFGSAHRFLPHVTLTSDISPSTHGSHPQAWLDSMALPSARHVEVKFETLASEDVFFRKLYIKCHKSAGLKQLAEECRRKVDGFGDEGTATAWAAEVYNPHLSLLYHDCPQVHSDGLAEVDKLVQDARVNLDGQGEACGWNGGRVVLVPTDQPIEQWRPIAERLL